jgi:hypothetical protein
MRRSLTYPPAIVLVETVGGVLVVQWEYTGIGGGHYDVYRQTVPDGAWQLVGSVPIVAELERPPNGGTYAWRDLSAQTGTTYRYGVVTVNSFGLHGPMMISTLVTAP